MPAYIRRGVILNINKSDIHNAKDAKDDEDDNPTFLKQVMD
ncbi:hypothetical protein [Candidatus Kryptobacter tengchongensis]|nr:hypothetical protein [Candidatus Kryptobacter tengchongensis]